MTLTGFFTLNCMDDSAHQYTYQELPQHFVWDRTAKVWNHERRGGIISQMYFVSPVASEHFYLQTLLTTVKGPCSWEDLCTFDDIVHLSFHATCLTHSLLKNDGKWQLCLANASLTHVEESFHQLFCLILTQCFPSQPCVCGMSLKRIYVTISPITYSSSPSFPNPFMMQMYLIMVFFY